MLTVSLIGCGLWGPNLARNFFSHPKSFLKSVYDIDHGRAQTLVQRLRGVQAVENIEEILRDDDINAVLIATPLSTHYELAKAALTAGKHVFVEKPLTEDYRSAVQLTELAQTVRKVLMVGYVFLFNPGVEKAYEYVSNGGLGDIDYIYSVRTNLGPIRTDTNALWDLASHDVSIMLHCIKENPVCVSGSGGYFVGNKHADVATASIKFESGRMGFLYASWLDPCKIRRVTFVGKEKMLLFDDMAPLEPVKIFDKGVRKTELVDTYGMHQMGIRIGDILLPRLEPAEPLNRECEAFITACLENKENPAIGELPIKITALLSAIQKSMDKGGAPVHVEF